MPPSWHCRKVKTDVNHSGDTAVAPAFRIMELRSTYQSDFTLLHANRITPREDTERPWPATKPAVQGQGRSRPEARPGAKARSNGSRQCQDPVGGSHAPQRDSSTASVVQSVQHLQARYRYPASHQGRTGRVTRTTCTTPACLLRRHPGRRASRTATWPAPSRACRGRCGGILPARSICP